MTKQTRGGCATNPSTISLVNGGFVNKSTTCNQRD